MFFSPLHSPSRIRGLSKSVSLLIICRIKSNCSAWHERPFMNRHPPHFPAPNYSQPLWAPVLLSYLGNPQGSFALSWCYTLHMVSTTLGKSFSSILVGFSPPSSLSWKIIISREFSWSPETELGMFYLGQFVTLWSLLSSDLSHGAEIASFLPLHPLVFLLCSTKCLATSKCSALFQHKFLTSKEEYLYI